MPDMTIEIGGRHFTVACQEGEETYLGAAAELLDREAKVLVASGTRLTQERMLLMAGLMLADKAISAEEELKVMDRRLAEQDRVIASMKARPPEVREAIPRAAITRVDGLASRAEELAAKAREYGAQLKG
ncbi:cell division protein ZapA [uncultured Jannaschia sp.]|uniref:cell division protein ZapA n=1 Tax=uncultured Jannaschia sp. TaxID=293347 RepID=UPI00262AE4FD|nr:cell division protein ZapA [uncultured Jannaschia sp.]